MAVLRARWRGREVYDLLRLAETKTRREIAEAMGISPKTVANRLALLGSRTTEGLLTLREAVRRTGYDKCQLYRARDALKQVWKRPTKRGEKTGISEDQLDRLCNYLRNEGATGPCTAPQ